MREIFKLSYELQKTTTFLKKNQFVVIHNFFNGAKVAVIICYSIFKLSYGYKNFDWRKNCGSGEFFDFQIEFLRFQIEFWDFGEIEFLRKRPKKTLLTVHKPLNLISNPLELR